MIVGRLKTLPVDESCCPKTVKARPKAGAIPDLKKRPTMVLSKNEI